MIEWRGKPVYCTRDYKDSDSNAIYMRGWHFNEPAEWREMLTEIRELTDWFIYRPAERNIDS
jgi:hypothetical protein